MRRRRFLKAASPAVLAGLAGCSGSDTDGGDTTDARTTPTTTSSTRTSTTESTAEETTTDGSLDLPWTQLPGPPGGPVTDISPSPADPEYLYTTTWTAGLYVSADGGESWIQGPPGEHHRWGIEASPHDPEEARSNLNRTVDGGETWYTEHDKPERLLIPGHEITAFVEFDPFDEAVLYAGTTEGLYRTFDRGRSWEHVDVGVETVTDTECRVAAARGREGVVYAAFNQDRTLVRSDDRGDSWHVVVGPDDAPETRGPLVVEQSGEAGYLTVGGHGVYRFGDGPPERVTPPFRFYNGLSLSADDERLYFLARPAEGEGSEMWADMGLYVYDAAAGETRGVEMPEKPSCVSAHPADPATVYFGGWSWVWESRDRGRTWTKLAYGFVDQYLTAVGVNPSRPGTVIPGSACSTGLSVSHDHGETYAWKRSGLKPYHEGEFGEHYIQNVAAGGDMAYATTAAGLLVSDDNGETWRLLDTEFSGRGAKFEPSTPLSGLGVSPENPETVYVGTMLNGTGPLGEAVFDGSFVWRSRDGGGTWTQVTDGFPADERTVVTDVVVSGHDPDTVYLATIEGNKNGYRGEGSPGAEGKGIYRSTNGGDQWQRLQTPFSNVYSLTEDAGAAGRLYASTRHEIYRRAADGGSWKRVLPHESRAVLAHPDEPDVVFAGARKYDGYWDLLVSDDGGETWAEGGLTIKMDTEPGEREYDGVNRAGRWGEKGDILDLAVDESSSHLVAATLGAGLWRGDIDRLTG